MIMTLREKDFVKNVCLTDIMSMNAQSLKKGADMSVESVEMVTIRKINVP